MTTTVDSHATAQRPSSWRDEIFAEYEISQAALRLRLADEAQCPPEFL